MADEAFMPESFRGAAAGAIEIALEGAFHEFYPRLIAILCRMLGERAQAEELASDTFLKLAQQPMRPEEYDNLGGWLYRTATRLGIDSLRAAERRRRYEHAAGAESVAPASPLDEMLRAERCASVRATLARLKPIQAQILMLRSSGLSYKELAQALDVKPTSVGRLLARAEAAFEKAWRRVKAPAPVGRSGSGIGRPTES
jgi:RNA polymerase sigma-70 factor (ECF subfamily)